MTRFLWGVYPYVCVTLFLVVPILRMASRPFEWSTRASSLFHRRSLGVASLLMHWGLGFVALGHLSGLFGGLVGSEKAIDTFFWIGLVGGSMLLAGSTLALFRRLTIPEVRAMSQPDDFVIHLFIIPIVSLALYQVVVHRIFGIAFTAASWAASLWTLSPQPELMASASTITKVHVLLALTFFAYFPFTKLVHAWTYPVNYFVRPYQSMRTPRYRFQRRWELALRSDKSWLVYGLGTVVVVFLVAALLLGRSTPAGAATNAIANDDPNGHLVGYSLYVSQCARCHGVTGHGDGAGATSPTFKVPPRNLVKGQFRFVSTDNGVASPDDLRHTIRHGLPAGGMPAFDALSDEQVDSLVAVVESFWKGHATPGAPFVVPARATRKTDGSRALGAELFAKNCAACHGDHGRGDGPVGASLRDGDGNLVRPANLAAGELKAGREPEEIYRRVALGISAVGMPAFRSTLQPDDIWAIVDYLENDLLPQP